jgi:ATP-dependent helicase HrpA
LATNVAETSLTIPNIRFVVESGLVRLSRYNPYTHVQSLQIEQVSQASARQRRGRCGRVAEGQCVYLYSQDVLEQSPPYTDPEILRTSLAGVILQMKMLGLSPIERFAFINPPPSALIREGYRALGNLRALDKDDHLTPLGRQMAAFPLDPHLSRMVCQANVEGVLTEVLVVAAFLSIRDPRERPAEKQTLADQSHQLWSDQRSDFIAILNLWKGIEEKRKANGSNKAMRAFCTEHFLNYGQIQEWRNLWSDLRAVCRGLTWKVRSDTGIQSEYDYDRIHRSLLAGLPTSIGVTGEQRAYQATGDRKFYIFPGSGLFKQTYTWVMAFALVETTRLYARLVAQIDPTWLEDIVPHLCQFHYRDIHYSPKEGFVYALKTVTLGGLVIQPGKKVHYGSIDPKDARRIFIEEGMVKADLHSRHRWLIEHRQMLQDIFELEARMRKPGSLLNEKAIFDHFDKRLPSTVYSAQSLDKWLDKDGTDLAIKIEDAMIASSASSLTEEYPETSVYNGHPFKLVYAYAPGEANDGVSLICPTDLIWLLPSWALDWPVPGWLVEKVNSLIRSLPKPLRMACSPTMSRAGDFAKSVRTGSIDAHQPLVDALIGYLRESCQVAVKPTDFDLGRLPTYLHMKIIEVDAKGRQVRVHLSVPDRQEYTSKLSSSLGAVKEWNKRGTTEWPGQSLPDTVFLNKTRDLVGYPALVDEDTHVCQRVFLDEREAKHAHRAGVVRLFRLQHQDEIRGIERELPLSDFAKLSLRSLDITPTVYESSEPTAKSPVKPSTPAGSTRSVLPVHDSSDRGGTKVLRDELAVVASIGTNPREATGGWVGDLIDAAIWEVISDKGRHPIRTAEAYQARAETARGELFGAVEAKGALLNQMLKSRGGVLDKCKTLPGCKDNLRDIERQLAFLFRPGFIKDERIWESYPRYLKALYIRLERIGYSSVKDLAKLKEIGPLCVRFDEELQKIKSPALAFCLWEFAYLLQEYRVALFAPEVGTGQKVSTKRLERFWQEQIAKTPRP